MTTQRRISTQVVDDVSPASISTDRVEKEFLSLLRSSKMRVAGNAKRDPMKQLIRHQLPRHRIDLFDTQFYLTNFRQIPELRFFIGYVVQPNQKSQRLEVFPRILYKDLSLAWRSASHLSFSGDDIWVGKGDIRTQDDGEYEVIESDEATTDVPLEMQAALESLLRFSGDEDADPTLLKLVLREAPPDRIAPYRDFTAPRKLAASNPKNLINRGRAIAWFEKANDPTSLMFAKGFEPDFRHGVISKAKTKSRLYGGTLRRFRILSTNGQVQHYFIAGRNQTWMYPPQALTTELSSYGVRTISITVDDNAYLSGFEYHYLEDTPTGNELYSQIPSGFAGDACPVDDTKADASPWLDRLPVIRQFKAELLSN